MKETLLIIDDETDLRNLLSQLLGLEGYRILQASTGQEGLSLLEKEEPDVVITDVRLPDILGLDLAHRIREITLQVEIIVLTAYGTIEDGVRAIKEGAFDYITKGDEDNKIVPAVRKALEKVKMRRRIEHLEQKIGGKYKFDQMIGTSEVFRQAVDIAKKVSQTEVSVLLLGETGTGKEVFAQAIHYASPRKDFPFIAINCSAFAKELLESEIFGYKAGAFTGATKNKKGLFEEAHNGTLFLDEIGELDSSLQAKFLRVLETNSFIKQGDTKTTQVDVRIIAATNRNLETEIQQGHFRSDLFYRISVMKIELPPLRQRSEDIPLLSDYFIQIYSLKMNRSILQSSPHFLQKLKDYSFPGNIRELKNVIERAIILTEGKTLEEKVLPKEFFSALTQPAQNPSMSLEEVERHHILDVMQHAKNNKTKTAEILGIGLTTLYRKLQHYGIKE
ncbi:MAG: sigma-54 dependent transcriptional regulator [Planctomycetota bacterium]